MKEILASDMLIISLNIVSERSKCDEFIYREKHHLEMYNTLVIIYIYIISVFFWDNILVVWLLLYWPDYKTTPPPPISRCTFLKKTLKTKSCVLLRKTNKKMFLNYFHIAYFYYFNFCFECMVNTGKMYQQSHLKIYTFWYTIKITGSSSEWYNIEAIHLTVGMLLTVEVKS